MLYKKKSIINVPRGILLAKNPNSYTDMLRCALWFSHQHASFRLRPPWGAPPSFVEGHNAHGDFLSLESVISLAGSFLFGNLLLLSRLLKVEKNMHMENCV